MELVLWIVPAPDGALSSRLAPPAFEELKIPDDDGAGDDADRNGRSFHKGVLLTSKHLPFALTVGRDGALAPSESPFEPARVQLRLSLAPDPPAEGEVLAPGEDELGLFSLLSEYLDALTDVVDALRLPLRAVCAERGGVVLEVGPLTDDADAPAIERLVLLRVAADLLARARGFRVRDAEARLPRRPWRDVDGHLRAADLEG